MRLFWTKKDFQDDIEFILFHQHDDTPEFWRKQLFKAYPDLDYEYTKSLPESERFKFITKQMKIKAQKFRNTIDKSVKTFQQFWDDNIADKLNEAYGLAFDNDCSKILNKMKAEVGLNPICPRNISDHSFHIYHRLETKWAMSTALHEITHFVWFYFWHKHFKDKPKEYNSPNLKWLLSEIVVETIIRNSDIGKLSEQPKWIAYSYFYDMKIGNKLIFDTMRKMYVNRKDIFDFMEKSFDWIQSNETQLRAKIARVEQ